MRFTHKAAVIAVAIGLAAAVAWAQGSATLRLKPAVGNKFQYKVTMNTSAGAAAGDAGKMNATFNQWYIVKARNAKGINFQIKVTNAKFTGGAPGMDPKQMEDAVEKSAINATYSPLAAYVSGDMNMGGMGAMAAQAGLQGVIFPQAAVKAGSTWTATFDIGKLVSSAGGQGMRVVSGGKVPVRYKLTGFKTVAGKQVASITGTMNGNVVMAMGQGQNQGQMKMNLKATSTFQLDTRTGMLRSATTNANVGTTFGNMNMNQTVKMTMSLM
jgi:hypothetical protein